MTPEKKKILGDAFHKALAVTQKSASHGAYLRNSKPEIDPDSMVSVKINGKEILTTGAELEKVLKEFQEESGDSG